MRQVPFVGGEKESLYVTSRCGAAVPVRWVLIHMVEETARHAGHVDIVRELLDGATGDHPEGDR
jgi:hypothetical protein